MPDNLTIRDGNGNATLVRTTEVAGVHIPHHVPAGYDAQDDMLKVKSIQKKWRDSFTMPLSNQWDVVSSGGVTATSAGGVLTIASGTNAGGFVELVSKQSFTIPCRAMAGVQTGVRQANTHEYIELVSVDPVTGIPDDRNRISVDLGGSASTTVTQMIHEVQNGGITPLASTAVTISSTNTYSVLEVEPFSDEAYFHSRAMDSPTGRTNSYVRHQQLPDPNAVYKLRVRVLNHAAWRPIIGAVAGVGNVITLTVTGHGYVTGATVWVESLHGVTNNGAIVRGNYVITVVDANTISLDGTIFAGTYSPSTGRVALAAAPAASHNLQFQFINVQDYAELTAEITAGRGQTAVGQAIAVSLVQSGTGTSSISVQGTAAHDAVVAGSPIRIAGRGLSAAYTTVATGDTTDLITTLQGVLISRPWQIPELEWSYTAAAGGIVNTTDVVLAAAAGAGLRRYLTSLQIKGTNGVATEIVVKDGATIIWRGHVSANMLDMNVITFSNPLRTTANAALNVACITTGAAVYVNAQGYTAP